MLEEMADKELEEQLMEAGTRLLTPPSSVEELLSLLDQVESCLSRVEQSPSKSMQNALSPSLKALIASDLLRHSDTDVKVSVASCVSEITRITAPDAPYEDDQMKQIFQLIVAAFEKMYDTSSRSYSKRVSILETVAKVRSCVVMLDLECDALILEMFQHFLTAVRDFHPENVFSSMETIMSLVLEESEEISAELLSPLLTSVRKENQDALPIARKLGEKVLENCTSKLKPYLMQAVKSMGMSLNDYTKIVASICQETSDTTEVNDDSVSGEHLADEGKLPEKSGSDKAPQVAEELEPQATCPGEVDRDSEKSAKLMTSNGDAQAAKDGAVVGITSPEKKLECSQPTEVEPDSLDPKIAKSESKPDQATKQKKGRKSNSSMHTAEASDHSKIDSDKETIELPYQIKSHSKEEDNSISEDPSIDKLTVPSESEKEALAPISSPTASRDEPVKVALPSPSQSLPDGGRSKRGRLGRAKKGNVNEDTDHGSPSVPKEPLLSEQVESESPVSTDRVSKRGPEGNSEMEEKPLKRLGKKEFSENENEDNVTKKKSSGATSDSEAKLVKKSGKKVDMQEDNDDTSEKHGGKTKRGRGKTISEKDIPGESSNKKMVSSPKSVEKTTGKNQKQLDESPKTKSKRKRTPEKEETSEKPSVKDFGENLVGSKIKVWWPDDQTFYEGVIDSFDPVKKKHQVLYVDGDEETLLLKRERWEFVEDDTVPDGGQATDLSSPDAASEMPQKKKAKTTSGSATKQAKTDASLKKGKEGSTSKSKDEATRSSGKSKNDGKLASKTMEDTPKTVSKTKNDSSGKSKGNTPKTGTKSKNDTPKTGTKSKDDTPKTVTKSKDDTPKTETKSKDDTPKTGKMSKDDTLKTSTKSKDATPKTSTKSKDDMRRIGTKSKNDTPRTGSKSKDDTPKTGTKSKDGTSKTGSKSKDETPNTGTKSEDDDTPKTRTKLKNITPKTGSKSRTNGTSAKGKSGAARVEESEELAKGKSLESAKTQESETKSGKKRRR